MHFLTDFADQAVVLPTVVAVALAFAAAGWRRGAAAWAIAVPATLALVLLAKIVVYAYAAHMPLPDGLRSPSGHTASAAVVYGGLAALLVSRRGRYVGPLLLGAGFAVVFGFTRLALHLHSRSDVLVGGLIGIAGAMALAALAGERPARMHTGWVLAAALTGVLLFHGDHLHAEGKIWRASQLVRPITLALPR